MLKSVTWDLKFQGTLDYSHNTVHVLPVKLGNTQYSQNGWFNMANVYFTNNRHCSATPCTFGVCIPIITPQLTLLCVVFILNIERKLCVVKLWYTPTASGVVWLISVHSMMRCCHSVKGGTHNKTASASITQIHYCHNIKVDTFA